MAHRQKGCPPQPQNWDILTVLPETKPRDRQYEEQNKTHYYDFCKVKKKTISMFVVSTLQVSPKDEVKMSSIAIVIKGRIDEFESVTKKYNTLWSIGPDFM